MKPIRLTAIVAVAVALACAPRPGQAGTPSAPTAKTCFFVRNHLPCPCPHAQQARTIVHAARVATGAVGNALGKTVVALSRAEHNQAAPAHSRPAGPRTP